MALFFLMVSLMCSAIREGLETVMKTRAMNLERGIRELLDDPSGENMVRSVFQHAQIFPLIRGDYDPSIFHQGWARLAKGPAHLRDYWRARKALPTYIPARQFASAVMDIVLRGPGTWPYPVAPQPMTIAALRERAAYLPSARMQRAVLGAIDQAEGDLQKTRANLEFWFDASMDRVSGWYKQHTQIWLFVIGFVVAVVLNLDALTVLQRLNSDEALRTAWVAQASRVVEEGINPDTTTTGDAAPLPAAGGAPTAADDAPAPRLATAGGGRSTQTMTLVAPATPAPVESPTTGSARDAGGEGDAATAGAGQAQTETKNTNSLAKVKKLRSDLDDLGAPIGWGWVGEENNVAWRPLPQNCRSSLDNGACTSDAPWPILGAYWLPYSAWWGALFGWLITGIAVTFGAPFWFDVLNKFTVIRSTVKPHEKSREEGSKDPGGNASSGSPPMPTFTAAIAPSDGNDETTAPTAPPSPPDLAPDEVGFQPEEWETPNEREIAL